MLQVIHTVMKAILEDMVRLGWWMLMLVLYSSSGGLVKLGMMDAYIGAV